MTLRPFTGQVLFRDRPTTDGRRFTADANLTWRDTPIRVFARRDDRDVIGEITLIDDHGSHLVVSGTVDLEPGDYPCGADMDSMQVAVPADPSDLDVQALLDGDETYLAGRLAALTIYTAPDDQPAWPGCHITVRDEES